MGLNLDRLMNIGKKYEKKEDEQEQQEQEEEEEESQAKQKKGTCIYCRHVHV